MFKSWSQQDENKKRKTRSDKLHRVNCGLSEDDHLKLQRLALACGNMPKTVLGAELIRFCLNHPDIIVHFQDVKFPFKSNVWRIVPVIDNGKCYYNHLHELED